MRTMRTIALALCLVLPFSVPPPVAANEVVENVLGTALVLTVLFGGIALVSPGLAELWSEDPDVSRFFVSPRTNTDTGITFGYQFRF